jgi:hypothetical protein
MQVCERERQNEGQRRRKSERKEACRPIENTIVQFQLAEQFFIGLQDLLLFARQFFFAAFHASEIPQEKDNQNLDFNCPSLFHLGTLLYL